MSPIRRDASSRPDPYLAIRGDAFRQQTEALWTVTSKPSEVLLLVGAYILTTLAIVEDGGPPVDHDKTMSQRTRMSVRLWRSVAAKLEKAGLLFRTPAGGWMTPLAGSELSRRAERARSRVSGDATASHAPVADENLEKPFENNSSSPPILTISLILMM